MKVSDIMTPSPYCCAPTDSLQEVARGMRDYDCGAVPVVDNGNIIGIVTDRDLAIRAIAEGRSPDEKVESVCTPSPQCCRVDDDVRDVQRIMSERQVRRVPVVDAEGRCVGIVSQADLARGAASGDRISDREIAIVVERVSEPSRGDQGANSSSAASAVRSHLPFGSAGSGGAELDCRV